MCVYVLVIVHQCFQATDQPLNSQHQPLALVVTRSARSTNSELTNHLGLSTAPVKARDYQTSHQPINARNTSDSGLPPHLPTRLRSCSHPRYLHANLHPPRRPRHHDIPQIPLVWGLEVTLAERSGEKNFGLSTVAVHVFTLMTSTFPYIDIFLFFLASGGNKNKK